MKTELKRLIKTLSLISGNDAEYDSYMKASLLVEVNYQYQVLSAKPQPSRKFLDYCHSYQSMIEASLALIRAVHTPVSLSGFAGLVTDSKAKKPKNMHAALRDLNFQGRENLQGGKNDYELAKAAMRLILWIHRDFTLEALYPDFASESGMCF